MRDPIWEFIGVIVSSLLAIASTALSVVLYLRQKSRKELICRQVSLTPLLSTDSHLEDGIIHDGFPFPGIVDTAVIRLSATGNTPILPEDFVEPVKFHFGEETTILDLGLLERTPEDLRASLEKNGGTITLAPTLLNPGNSLVFWALLAGFKGNMRVLGRVVGVDPIILVSGTGDEAMESTRRRTWAIVPIMAICNLVLWALIALAVSFALNLLPTP